MNHQQVHYTRGQLVVIINRKYFTDQIGKILKQTTKGGRSTGRTYYLVSVQPENVTVALCSTDLRPI